jgi:hypothetical protein
MQNLQLGSLFGEGIRLAKKGLPHNAKCVFLQYNRGKCPTSFFCCAIVNIIWSATLNWANMAQLTPSMSSVFRSWWEQASDRLQGREKNEFKYNCDAYSVDYLARKK